MTEEEEEEEGEGESKCPSSIPSSARLIFSQLFFSMTPPSTFGEHTSSAEHIQRNFSRTVRSAPSQRGPKQLSTQRQCPSLPPSLLHTSSAEQEEEEEEEEQLPPSLLPPSLLR